MGKMFVKLAALVLVGLGVWAAVGFIGSHIPNGNHTAFMAGKTAITYGYCVWGAMIALGLVIVGKVRG